MTENSKTDSASEVNKGPSQPGKRIEKTQYLSYLTSSAVANAVLPIFYIFIPIYALKIGANAFELGLIGGSSYAVYSFMPFVMGHFSDRKGSRIFFIVMSFVLLAVVSFLYSISINPVSLIVVRLLEGTGWAMLWPAVEAAITEDTLRESKKSLSVFNYTWSGGAACGPAIGTFLVTTYSYSTAFDVSGVLFIALIAFNIWPFLNRSNIASPFEGRNFQGVTRTRRTTHELLISKDSKRNIEVWTALTVLVLTAVTSGVFFSFFGPYAKSFGLSLVLIGSITTTYGVTRFVTYIALSKSSLHLKIFENPRRNLLVFGGIAPLSALLLIFRDPTGSSYFLAFAIFAVCYSFVYAISQLVLISQASKSQMGAGAGLFESAIGFGGFIGPIIGGVISSRATLQISFVVPAMCLVFGLGLLYLLSSLQKRKERQPL